MIKPTTLSTDTLDACNFSNTLTRHHVKAVETISKACVTPAQKRLIKFGDTLREEREEGEAQC